MIKENNIFIVGIKGVAMTNLAIILKKMGKKVNGSDTNEEFITSDSLVKNNIPYIKDFAKENLLKDTELVIYSAAHEGINNPQVQEAMFRKIKVQSQPEVLNDLLAEFTNTLAVCGCHGKTTTSSLLAYTLINLGVNPSYLVGSSGFNQFTGGDYQRKDYFVIEADEYGVNPPIDKTPKLSFLKPKFILCTNIDFDHPDVYQNIDQIKDTFFNFFQKAKVFICADDQNSVEVAGRLDKKNYLTYGFNGKVNYQIINYKTDENGSNFELVDPKNNHYFFRIGLFGQKNVSNAAGVIALLLHLGFSYKKIKSSIEGFIGAKRRFEKIAEINGIYLFDDYGHHPKEIEATVSAARERFPGKRIVVIFQPHTYSRTKALLEDFRKSLSMADLSLLLPIFPSAREKAVNFQVASKDILKSAYESKEDLLDKLTSFIKRGDVIFTMGAGDVYKLKDDIIKAISKTKNMNIKLEKNKDISNFMTLHTQVIAKYYCEVRTKEDFQEVVKTANNLNLPLLLLGGGSNIVITDSVVNALVVRNCYFKKEIIHENEKEVDLLVSSGYPTNKLVIEIIEDGYEGLEYHKGLPGTIGGAIYMNSKWTKPLRYISDYLIKAELLNQQGVIKEVDHDYFDFKYDFSQLHKTKEIIIDLIFRFKKTNKKVLEKRAQQAADYRLKTQPKGVSTCGCFFRNISEKDKQRLNLPTNSVGYILDKLNLKGLTVGDFMISDVHANFIINKGEKKGKSEDLKKLLKIIKDRVKDKFGVELKEEVILI